MILFIHGFGSSGFSFKAERMREYYEGREPVLAPSLPYPPGLAIQTLEEIITYALEKKEHVGIVGSSLGGYYALYLGNKFKLKTVLVNPAVYAYKRLAVHEGLATNYYDLSKFEWNASHIEALKKLKVEHIYQERVLLMLQKGDEVLDYREALEMLPDAHHIVEEGGDHSFLGFKEHLGTIEKFFKSE